MAGIGVDAPIEPARRAKLLLRNLLYPLASVV